MQPQHKNAWLTAVKWGKSRLQSSRRPALVTWLSLGVLIFSAVQFAGLAAALALPDIPLTVPVWYLIVKKSLWAVASLVAALGMFFGNVWAIHLLRWTSIIINVWLWLDRAILVRSNSTRQAWLLPLGFSVLTLFVLFGVLGRESAKRYFYGD